MDDERVCAICGLPVTCGMTDNVGTFYCHEGKCFHKYMNRTYGKHKWMELGNGELDEFDGFYIASADVPGGYQGTGIFYTEWE